MVEKRVKILALEYFSRKFSQEANKSTKFLGKQTGRQGVVFIYLVGYFAGDLAPE